MKVHIEIDFTPEEIIRLFEKVMEKINVNDYRKTPT